MRYRDSVSSTFSARRHRTRPAVSVLLPFRDAEGTLAAALRSLRVQSWTDFECVLVDNGSTDGSGRIAAAVAAADPRFRVVGVPGSFVRALNAGVALARAPWIARMDADDLCHPERLARQLAAVAADPGLSVVSCRVRCFPRASLRAGMLRYERWLNGLLTPKHIRHALFIESPLPHPSVLVRRDALLAAGGYRDFHGPEDYDLWLRLLLAGHRAVKVPHTLLAWRESPQRLSRRDPRYGRTRFEEVKIAHLPRVVPHGESVQIWGAGPIGKRWGRRLRRAGWKVVAWIDVNPRKVGRHIAGLPVLGPHQVRRENGRILLAVGLPGAREQIEEHLAGLGLRPWRDYLALA